MGYSSKYKLAYKDMSAQGKRLWDGLAKIDIIPPLDVDKGYTNQKYKYFLDVDTGIAYSERQINYAKILAHKPQVKHYEAMVEAGYEWKSFCYGDSEHFKRNLIHKARTYLTENVTALVNYLKYDSALQLKIDATWLLNEQVSLYEQCRREGEYSSAVRLLNDISYHVDVDSRVSNKIEITDSIDYAALLQQADKRVSLPNPDIIDVEVIPITEQNSPPELKDTV